MPTREHKLVRAFVELSDALSSGDDVPDLMYTLVERCVEILDVTAAGLMLVDPEGRLRPVAHSGPEARFIELLEVQQEEGPCYDAFKSGQVVISTDLEADRERWPKVAEESLRAGFRAAHGVPLRLRDHVIGAMNFFRDQPGELDQADQDAARALAEIATIAILQARALSDAKLIAEQLQGALDTRVVIEQAKGILSASGEFEVDEAFRRIRRHARNHGLRLDEVARKVVSGQLLPTDLDGIAPKPAS